MEITMQITANHMQITTLKTLSKTSSDLQAQGGRVVSRAAADPLKLPQGCKQQPLERKGA